MTNPVVPVEDANYLKVETPTSTSRWALAIELGGDRSERLLVDDLRAHVGERMPAVPWMAWRMHGRGARPARYRWVDTSPVPLDELVLRETLPGARVEDYLADLLFRPLGMHLPLWRIRLLDHDDGTQHVIFDGHHAAGGGHMGITMLEAMFGPDPGPPREAAVRPSATVAWWTDAAEMGLTAAAVARRAIVRLRPAPAWEPARSGPPLVGPLSPGRRIAACELSFDRVEAIAASHGASPTRVIAALVATALDDLVADPAVTMLRAVFPRGTHQGGVAKLGNTARSSFLDLPLRLGPTERIAALKDCFTRSATVADERPAVADLVLSLQPPMGELSYRGRPVARMVAGAPLRICTHPLTRLSVIVVYYGRSLFVSVIGDEAGIGGEVDGVAGRLVEALDRFEADAGARR